MQATPNRPYPPLHILVTGLPNTGKSTLINALRVYGMGYGSARGSKRVATVGKEPGQTLALSGMIKVVDTETVALQHVYGSTRLLDTRQSQLAAETPVARLLRSMNVRLKVFVMDTPGLLPPNIPNPHVGVKLALAGCVPDDSSGMRGADSYLLCEYLWWRMRERWHIAEQVLRAIDYRHGREATARSTVAATGDDTLPSVDDLLRHFARQHYAKKGRRLPEASGKQLSAMDMDVATGAFLKLWRTGDLYRKMQLLPSSSTTATGRQAAIAKDLWRVTMLDDDFAAGQEHVEAWFKRKYHGASDGEEAVATGAAQTTMRTTHNHLIYRPEIPTMATTTKLGAMNVTDDEMLNARERQKRRRQSVKRRR